MGLWRWACPLAMAGLAGGEEEGAEQHSPGGGRREGGGGGGGGLKLTGREGLSAVKAELYLARSRSDQLCISMCRNRGGK